MENYPIFIAGCLSVKLPTPEKEVQFAKEYKRKWRCDYLFTGSHGQKVAVEIEGGVWAKGRHVRPKGFIEDMHKYNCYAMLGIAVLRFTSEQANKQPILCARIIKAVLDGEPTADLFKQIK